MFNFLTEENNDTLVNKESDNVPVFNSEMDDIDVPEDMEIPSSEQLLKLTTQLDKHVKEIEDAPDTAKPQRSPVVIPSDVGEDLLSVTSDVNQQGVEISALKAKVSEMGKWIPMITELDATIRTSSAKQKEDVESLKAEIKQLSMIIRDLRQGFSMYQTATAARISDVERKLLTGQGPSPPVEVREEIVPPDTVTMVRDPEMGATTDIPPVPKPKIAILNDF